MENNTLKPIFKKRSLTLICLVVVVVLAIFLRFYKLDQIPPSLNWDEAAAGYNAFTIANWGRDEWGNFLPIIFTSFRDDKHPVHIYTTSIFIKLFGVSDFVTRAPAATFGVLNVVLIFFLVKKLFRSNLAAFFSSLLLAISPYDIHFSRDLWELNFALFYYMLGLYLFFLSVDKRKWFLLLSTLSFILSVLSYHPSIVVVPLTLITLLILYFKDLLKIKKQFLISLLIFGVFVLFAIIDPRITGLARVNQTKFSDSDIQKTNAFQKTHSMFLGLGEIIFNQYLIHFSVDYLYLKGDQSPRNSIKVLGEFYKIEAPFLIAGSISLLILRSKTSILLFVWLLTAPLPSAAVIGAPSASRALFMLGVFQIIEGFGIASLLSMIRKLKFRYFIATCLVISFLFSLKEYTDFYFTQYSKKDAVDWQYGMKQVVEFVKKNPDYSRVYMTDVRSQPYIFFLYYLKYPLPKFLETVQYTQNKTKSYNTVYSFDNYQFGGWDEIQSMPDPGLLYIVEDSKYGGLAHQNDFVRVEKIKFPDGSTAFYIVSKY